MWANNNIINNDEQNELHNIANNEIDKLASTEEATADCVVKKTLIVCTSKRCMNKCTESGFIGGQCTKYGSDVLNKCYCQKEGCDEQTPKSEDFSPSATPVGYSSDLSQFSDFYSDLSPSNDQHY